MALLTEADAMVRLCQLRDLIAGARRELERNRMRSARQLPPEVVADLESKIEAWESESAALGWREVTNEPDVAPPRDSGIAMRKTRWNDERGGNT